VAHSSRRACWRGTLSERIPAVIPDSFKQELLHRVDIVDVIERYVPLKEGRSELLCLLPVPHREDALVTVSPTQQFYHAFGCACTERHPPFSSNTRVLAISKR